MLKTVIVDDEAKSRANLLSLLEGYCPEVEVLADFESPVSAISFLEKEKIHCIFLDIEMPEMTGFEFLEKVDRLNIKVVFVTAYASYAIQAIKAMAFDYILKPIKISELENTVARLKSGIEKESQELEKPDVLTTDEITNGNHHQGAKNHRISVPDAFGFKLIDTTKIIRVEADGGYCRIYVQGEKPFLVSRNIGHIESLLDPGKFVRVHHSHVINLDFLDKYSSEDGGISIMKDGTQIGIARRRVRDFKLKVNAYYS